MHRTSFRLILIGLMFVAGAASFGAADEAFTDAFDVERTELASRGRNPYFILEPGFRLVFEGGDERLVITVLDETRQVDGVETRVVEERETKGGALVEISRNYFAICRRTNGVYYFGEEVDIYEDGKIAAHEGAWLSGVDGARFGLAIPGEGLLGARYYQEVAPRVAMDRAEIVSTDETVAVPAGRFTNCLKTLETTPLEPEAREFKLYARGVGLVQEGQLKLVEFGKPAAAAR